MSVTNYLHVYFFFLYCLHCDIFAWWVTEKMFRSIKIYGLFDTTNFVLSSPEHSGNINKSLCQDTEENRLYLVLSHEKLKLHSV